MSFVSVLIPLFCFHLLLQLVIDYFLFLYAILNRKKNKYFSHRVKKLSIILNDEFVSDCFNNVQFRYQRFFLLRFNNDIDKNITDRAHSFNLKELCLIEICKYVKTINTSYLFPSLNPVFDLVELNLNIAMIDRDMTMITNKSREISRLPIQRAKLVSSQTKLASFYGILEDSKHKLMTRIAHDTLFAVFQRCAKQQSVEEDIKLELHLREARKRELEHPMTPPHTRIRIDPTIHPPNLPAFVLPPNNINNTFSIGKPSPQVPNPKKKTISRMREIGTTGGRTKTRKNQKKI